MSRLIMSGEILTIFGILGFLIIIYFDSKSLEFKESINDSVRFKRNLSYTIASIIVILLMNIISKNIKYIIPRLLPINHYLIIDLICCFLFAELLNWIFHYLKHHNSLLWKFHFQHHIDSKYTTWLTSHTHGGEVLISGTIMSILLTLIGFSTMNINIYFIFYALANTYQHSNKNLSLGFLDKIIVSPRYHRVHHSKSKRANYGSTLTIWDIIFKTAYWPKKNQIFTDIGIDSTEEPFGYFDEMFYIFKHKSKNKKFIRKTRFILLSFLHSTKE